MEEEIIDAVSFNNVKEVKEILMKNPDLDVNWRDEYGDAVLQVACQGGHDAIVSILALR